MMMQKKTLTDDVPKTEIQIFAVYFLIVTAAARKRIWCGYAFVAMIVLTEYWFCLY